MEIPPQHRKIVGVICALILLGWIGWFFYRCGRAPEGPPYSNWGMDFNIGWVLSKETQRVVGKTINAVILLPVRENKNGVAPEKMAYQQLDGFMAGLFDDQGNPLRDAKILGKKYRSDATMDVYTWPQISVITAVAQEYPSCNAIISFAGPPTVMPNESGTFDPSRLPRLFVFSAPVLMPDRWQGWFAPGLMEVLITAKPGSPQPTETKSAHAFVEQAYYIIRKENVGEMAHQALTR